MRSPLGPHYANRKLVNPKYAKQRLHITNHSMLEYFTMARVVTFTPRSSSPAPGHFFSCENTEPNHLHFIYGRWPSQSDDSKDEPPKHMRHMGPMGPIPSSIINQNDSHSPTANNFDYSTIMRCCCCGCFSSPGTKQR